MREILKLSEVAEILRVTPRSLANLASLGEIPAVKVGGTWRVFKDELEEWLYTKHNQSESYPSKSIRVDLDENSLSKPGISLEE